MGTGQHQGYTMSTGLTYQAWSISICQAGNRAVRARKIGWWDEVEEEEKVDIEKRKGRVSAYTGLYTPVRRVRMYKVTA